MKTYEMIVEADKNGNTYKTGDMYYTVGIGFHDDSKNEWSANAWNEQGLDAFVHCDGWEIFVESVKEINFLYDVCNEILQIFINGRIKCSVNICRSMAERIYEVCALIKGSGNKDIKLKMEYV